MKQKPLSSDAAVKAAEPGEHTVTGVAGLLLRVHAASGGAFTRSWIVRVTDNGRRRRLGLGQYPTIGLAQARQKAADAHRAVAEGNDPGVRAKRRQQAALAARSLTLIQAIDGYLASAARPFKNAKSDVIRNRALRVHFAPLHSRDVATISAADVASLLRALSPGTAVKAHIVIRSVFEYAAAMLEPHGVVIINPADPRRLRQLGWSPKSRSDSKSQPAVDWRDAPSVINELNHMDEAAAACVLLAVATGMRVKTARLAKWSDIKLDECTWTPPLADLKERHHKRPFVIPLNDIALDALKRSRASSRFVFGPLSESILNSFLRGLRRRHPDWRDPHTNEPFTIHGFRATFRTWAEERHHAGRDLAELCLGHKVHGDVAGRYIRTGLLAERRALLDAWSQHLRGETAEVIQFQTAR